MEEEPLSHVCPQCCCSEVSWIGYSCPAQATCAKCGTRYEFGGGIKLMGFREGIERRPQLYENLRCDTCGKYRLGVYSKLEDLTDKDKEILCVCIEETSL